MTESFEWNRPDLNWAHFHSLANLLSLRNGGQAEPAAFFEAILEQDREIRDDGDEDSHSVNTDVVNQISDSGHSKLKRRFLDGLAGLAANEEGGKAVACSAMKEAEDDVVIWLARNGGFSGEDKRVFDSIAELLSSMSCGKATETGKKFANLQKQKPYVHAEVQMMVFLAANEPINSKFLPYLGCSKLSCFMCNQFLQAYGLCSTRGCHGRLFKPWTVPSADRLLPGHADRIARALTSVQEHVKNKLRESVKSHVRLERTSVVGGSSIAREQPEDNSSRRSQIDELEKKATHARVAASFRRSASYQTHRDDEKKLQYLQ
ncbi:unnamed protein product [Alternaria alternata]